MTKQSINYKYKSFVPYRVCLLGAHIDHQKGIITGMAIDKGIKMKYSATEDGSFLITSYSYEGIASFNYDNLPPIQDGWQDYLIASIKALQEKYELKKGLHAYIYKSLPTGGLASSSAIIITYLLALAKVNNIKLNEDELIKLMLKTENKYLNIKSGYLDPACEIYSKKNHLLYLDIKKNKYELIPFNKQTKFKICIIYSGVPRTLRNTMYNKRVDDYKRAAYTINNELGKAKKTLEESFLRDFTKEEFEQCRDALSKVCLKRATHYYGEMDRISKGVRYFRNGNLNAFGKYVFESGWSSINYHETGSAPLETLHKIAEKTEGIYGGRFSGAGFNGYYIAIIDPAKEDEIKKTIKDEYLKLFPEYKKSFKIFMCNTVSGVKL